MSWEESGGLSCDEVSVADVYELAATIGKQCEMVIAAHGPEAVAGLLPKLVAALELLEALAARGERERLQLQELTDKVLHLEHDKLERQQCRQRFDKELEIIEEQWRTESSELMAAITKLEEENRRLRKEREGSEPEPEPINAMTTSTEQLWIRMGETNEQQRVSLREKDVLIEDKETIIEGLTDQVKRLAASNREARRKQKYLMQQMRLLCAQRAELEAGLQARQREVGSLREALTNEQNGSGNGAQMAELIKERDQLREKLENLERKIKEESEPPTSLEIPDEGSSAFPDDDEPPVQGPLPYEPDDAPWKRQQSGIRKLWHTQNRPTEIDDGQHVSSRISFSSALTEEECSCRDNANIDHSGPSSRTTVDLDLNNCSQDTSGDASEYTDAVSEGQFISRSIDTKSDICTINLIESFGRVSSDLPDYGMFCRFCLKRKSAPSEGVAMDLATEILTSQICDGRVKAYACPTEFIVCVAAAIECLISLWLRHFDHT